MSITNKPLISIIVPVYKVEKYIDKCIQSILNQTYDNLQIILVDDGSPDKCGEICDKYAKQEKRIEAIHKSNGGLSDARNVGISKAKGKYIGFVDSDDYINQDMYQNMYKLVEEKQADVCICNFYDVINNKNIIRNENNGIKLYNKEEILKEVLLDKNIQSYAWNKLYKRELFDNIQYPIGKKYEDIGTTFYIFEKCNKVVVTGIPQYYYLNRKDSIVNNVTEQTVIDYIDIISDRYNHIEMQNSQLIQYNDYYLAKTLITAYTDLNKLPNAGEKINNRVNNLHNKVKKLMKEHGTEFMDLLDEKQIKQLNIILSEEYKIM